MGYRKKPFLPLSGQPVLARTVALFEAAPLIETIILVVPEGDEEVCRRDIVEPYRFRKVAAIVRGGEERQDSVEAALASLTEKWDILVVHDGVRPFASPGLIEEVVKRADRDGAAIAAVPVKDTVKEVAADGTVTRTVPRERLWAVQTPQAFRADHLIEAHRQARRDGFRGTDDAALVERIGVRVSVVEGSYENIKITTPEDIEVGEALLKRGAAAPGEISSPSPF